MNKANELNEAVIYQIAVINICILEDLVKHDNFNNWKSLEIFQSNNL